MKKAVSILLACCMAAALAGCGATAAPGTTASSPEAASTADAAGTQTYTVGICQLVQHAALDAATQGFQDALTEKLGDRVTFDLQNAQGDTATCATVMSGFVSSKVDLIMANATAPLQAAAAATDTIPVLGTSVTDYATALDIDDWTGTTGKNISGTSDLTPLDEQAKMIQELLPNAKQVAILYCSAEANSVYQAKTIEGYLDAAGIAYKEYSAADSNEIQAVTSSAIADCDAVYIPTDNTMAASTEIVNNICTPAGIPVIAGEEGICKGCGVATLSISYYDLGYKTGEMAYEVLVNGADPATMAVAYAPTTTREYIASRAEALGITIPESYVAIEEN
ncbi:MAG: ABC transporter substrate-binding protein [Gemmiger sp.]|nr:ABC transporter substrate-binding protein [Gemmiger sp.]